MSVEKIIVTHCDHCDAELLRVSDRQERRPSAAELRASLNLRNGVYCDSECALADAQRHIYAAIADRERLYGPKAEVA